MYGTGSNPVGATNLKDKKMKTKIIRDVPIGVLLIVLSLFFIYFVQYLSGFPQVLPLIGILLSSTAAHRLMSVGIDVITGIQIEDKNDQK